MTHKPVPLSDPTLCNLYTQNFQELNESQEKILEVAALKHEIVNSIYSKLGNEILELDEYKNSSLQTINVFIKQVLAEVEEAGKMMNLLIAENIEKVQRELKSALVLLKLSHDGDHPLLGVLLKCKSVEEVRNIEIIRKELNFSDVSFRDIIKDTIEFNLEILKDSTLAKNKFPNVHPGMNRIENLPRKERANSEDSPERTPRPILNAQTRRSFVASTTESSEIRFEPFDIKKSPLVSHSRTLPPDTQLFRFEETKSLSKIPLSSTSCKYIELGTIQNRHSLEPNPTPYSPPVPNTTKKFDALPPCLYSFTPSTNTLVSYNTQSKISENLTFENEYFYSNSCSSISEDGKLIMTGGQFNNSAKKYVFIYNLYEKFSERAPKMINRRYNHSQVSLANYVYVIGGRNSEELMDCERFNLLNKKWQKIGNLNYPREGSASCVHSTRIFVAGGIGVDSIETFNTISKKFSLIRVKLPSIGKCCLFPYNTSILMFKDTKVIELTPTKMVSKEISELPDNEYWTSCDPVITTDYIYFISKFSVFQYSVDYRELKHEFSFINN